MNGRMAETWGRFFVWAVVGVVVGLALVSFPSLALVIVLVAGILVAKRPSLQGSMIGALAGVGAMSLYVAFLQRRGPGTSCWQTASASGCDEYLNPLPWLVVGAALVAVAISIQVRHRREARFCSEAR